MGNISAEKLRELIFTNVYRERALHLSGNGLSKVPEAVFELTELEELSLSGNCLKELPTSINRLKNLKGLRLDRNQLRELPHSICELSNLTRLTVCNNQLSVLPPNIKHLKNLWVLDLSDNQLTTLPDEIGELKELAWLYVSSNKLTVLSSHIKHLNKLWELDLSGNQLTTLPDEIGELKKLRWLYVTDNPLTLEGMRKVVKLQNNKMMFSKDVTEHVFGREAEGQRAQLAYEKALRDGFVNVYRGRMLLIGQDRAGKTSLKKSLLGLPFDPKEQSTEGIEVQASTCKIEVEQVKNWHSTHENKPGLVISPKEISRMVAEKLCDITMELEKGHSTTATEVAVMTEEEHFKEEEGGLSEEISFGNFDRKVMDLEFGADRNDPNKHKVEEIVDSEISSPSREAKAVSKQSHLSNGEHFPECGSEFELNEPEIMINTTSPPDDVTKHVHQWLEYVRGKRVNKGDIPKGESVVSMDVWDFAGQQLYYASHPLFLSSRALYILVHNLSKPLLAQAQPSVRQGTCDIPLKNPNSGTNLENLLSWLVTIHSITQVKGEPDVDAESRLPYLRPPVLIVGTHADKQSPQDIAEMKSEIQKRISGKEYGKHVVPPLFSIDNTSSLIWNRIKRVFRQCRKERKHQTEQEGKTDDIQELQNKIMEVLRQEPYMGEKIPVKWFRFEKVIEALIAKRIFHIDLVQLQSYAKKHCFIEDEDEFAGMISFYHGLGMIIKHRSTVVLKAQWLIDLLKQLITIPHFDKIVGKNFNIRNFSVQPLPDLFLN